MEKIGIVTFHNVLNYGAVLQATGLQMVLRNLGVNSEIVDYRCNQFEEDYALIQPRKGLKSFLRSIALLPQVLKQRKAFEEYIKNHLILSEKTYSHKTIGDTNELYSKFITGSDQIWDNKCAGFDDTYFLSFVDNESKKYSYSASFNDFRIPKELVCQYKDRLSSFRQISCRERKGAEIVSDLLQRKVIRTVDPCLLLTKDEWRKLAKKPREKGYLLLYPVGYNKEMIDIAKSIAKKKGIKIVYFDTQRPWRDKDIVFVNGKGPDDYIGYFMNAECIVTNAFHGTIFSLIFEKEFYSFANDNSIRISEILGLCGLLNRRINTTYDLEILESPVDWKNVNKIIDLERNKSLEYLRKIIGK